MEKLYIKVTIHWNGPLFSNCSKYDKVDKLSVGKSNTKKQYLNYAHTHVADTLGVSMDLRSYGNEDEAVIFYAMIFTNPSKGLPIGQITTTYGQIEDRVMVAMVLDFVPGTTLDKKTLTDLRTNPNYEDIPLDQKSAYMADPDLKDCVIKVEIIDEITMNKVLGEIYKGNVPFWDFPEESS